MLAGRSGSFVKGYRRLNSLAGFGKESGLKGDEEAEHFEPCGEAIPGALGVKAIEVISPLFAIDGAVVRRREALSEDLHNAENELKKLRAGRESQSAASAQVERSIAPAIETGPFFRISISPEKVGPVAEL